MTRPSFNDAGRTRDKLMPADAGIPCQARDNRELFDTVIDSHAHKPKGRGTRAAILAAKRVCESCPVRVECLAVHGQDLELGVVAGLTDEERAIRLGMKSAPPEAPKVKPLRVTQLGPAARFCSSCGAQCAAVADETSAIRNLLRRVEKRPGTPEAKEAMNQVGWFKASIDRKRAAIAECCG